jgi:hypothetical protein
VNCDEFESFTLDNTSQDRFRLTLTGTMEEFKVL